jgi:hypothetical protein
MRAGIHKTPDDVALRQICDATCGDRGQCHKWCAKAIYWLLKATRNWNARSASAHRLAKELRRRALALTLDRITLDGLNVRRSPPLSAKETMRLLQRLAAACRPADGEHEGKPPADFAEFLQQLKTAAEECLNTLDMVAKTPDGLDCRWMDDWVRERWKEMRWWARDQSTIPLEPAPTASILEARQVAQTVLKYAVAEGDRAPEQAAIWYHGGQSYSTDCKSPVTVTKERHDLLQVFLDQNEARTTRELEQLVNNPSDVVIKIEKKFGTQAVRRPMHKGDGYFIRVRSAPSTGN